MGTQKACVTTVTALELMVCAVFLPTKYNLLAVNFLRWPDPSEQLLCLTQHYWDSLCPLQICVAPECATKY